MQLKHRICAGGFRAIATLGADRWLRPLTQGRGVILMLHRVRPRRNAAFAPNGGLEITPDFLECVLDELRLQGYEIVAIDAVPSRLASPAVSRPFAVLTFDDGYRDNVEHALPVLRRHNAPWCLFVTADFAGGAGRLWWLELEQAIRRLDRIVVHAERPLELPAHTSYEKQAAFRTIEKFVRAGPEQRLRAVMADIARQAEIDPGQLVRDACLDWEELRGMASEPGLTIGAHTVSHPILRKHDATTAMREIFGCKTILQRRLGRPVQHFAYPFGDRSAASTREFRLAREAGFATAVTSRPGHVFAGHVDGLHALPRVSINGLFQYRTAVRGLLSGVPFLALNGGPFRSVEASAAQ